MNQTVTNLTSTINYPKLTKKKNTSNAKKDLA